MTQEQIIDLVEEQFPNVRETQIRMMLNTALKQFCEYSLLVRSDKSVTVVADTLSYTLDDDILRVDSVIYTDSDGVAHTVPRLQGNIEDNKLTDIYQYAYFLRGGVMYIGTLDVQSLAALTAGNTITLRCRIYSADLSQYIALLDTSGDPIVDANGDPVYVVANALSDVIGVPSQFQEAPVFNVLERLYARDGDFKAAEYYARKWGQTLLSARRYANKDLDGSFYNVLIHEL